MQVDTRREREQRDRARSLCTYSTAFLCCGVASSVLIAAPDRIIGPERFLLPKEAVLHLLIGIAAAFSVLASERIRLRRTDLLLLCFLILSTAAAFGPVSDPRLIARPLLLTFTTAAVFWTARALASRGYGDVLLSSVVITLTAAAGIAVFEAYVGLPNGWESIQAPAGQMGNRNRLAHLLVIGTPAVLLWAYRRAPGAALPSACVAIVCCVLVLTRSRAAWVALASLGIIVGALATWCGASLRFWRGTHVRTLALSAGVGILAAAFVPNRLQWHSTTPLHDSAVSMLDLQRGSGYGRLLQQQNTLRMVWEHPWLGVGPGQWAVQYGHYATLRDPSYRPSQPAPTNQFPHGDWVGLAAERGIPALLVLACLAYGLVVSGVQADQAFIGTSAQGRAAALCATIALTALIGLADPIFVTPPAAAVTAFIIGLLADGERYRELAFTLPKSARVGGAVAITAATLAVSLMNVRKLSAFRLGETGAHSLTTMSRAVSLDPNSYMIRLRMAQTAARLGRCDLAREHAVYARGLFPTATFPLTMVREYCPDTREHEAEPALSASPPAVRSSAGYVGPTVRTARSRVVTHGSAHPRTVFVRRSGGGSRGGRLGSRPQAPFRHARGSLDRENAQVAGARYAERGTERSNYCR